MRREKLVYENSSENRGIFPQRTEERDSSTLTRITEPEMRLSSLTAASCNACAHKWAAPYDSI